MGWYAALMSCRNKKRKVNPESVQAMLASNWMKASKSNWLYKVAPQPEKFLEHDEESKYCSGEDPSYQEEFDQLVMKMTRKMFKECTKEFVEDAVAEALKEERYDQALDKKASMAADVMFKEFLRSRVVKGLILDTASQSVKEETVESAVLAEFKDELVRELLVEESLEAAVVAEVRHNMMRELWIEDSIESLVIMGFKRELATECLAEEHRDVELDGHAAVSAGPLFIAFRSEEIFGIALECMQEEEHEAALDSQAADVAGAVLKQLYRDLSIELAEETLTAERLFDNLSREVVQELCLGIAEGELDVGEYVVPEHDEEKHGDLSAYHDHLSREADQYMRRKLAFARSKIDDKRFARIRAKEKVTADTKVSNDSSQRTSSASSYLRKKAGYVEPGVAKAEMRVRDARGISSYLAKKHGLGSATGSVRATGNGSPG
jgi:hypothetical protein